MRAETRRKLEWALWRSRLQKAAIAAGVLAVIAGGLWLTDIDASVSNHRVPGIVSQIGPLNGTSTKAAAEGLAVDVTLDDGRKVQVMTLKTTDPHVGDHVQVTEHHHGTGRVTFTWK